MKLRCLFGHEWRMVSGSSRWLPSKTNPSLGWPLCDLSCRRCGKRTTVDEHEYFWGYTEEVR